MLSRLGEKVPGWIALGLLILLGVAIYQMPAETKSAIWSGVWRTTVWLLLAAAVPWSAAWWIRPVVRAGTNWAGIAAVAGCTFVDLLLGVALLSAWPEGGWAWGGAFAALGLAGFYNYLVLSYLAEMHGP